MYCVYEVIHVVWCNCNVRSNCNTLQQTVHVVWCIVCIWLYTLYDLSFSSSHCIHESRHTTATRCNTLYTWVMSYNCNTLQHTVHVVWSIILIKSLYTWVMSYNCNTLQHTALHCNTPQHTAAHCSTLQHTAPHCTTLHHTAPHYIILSCHFMNDTT